MLFSGSPATFESEKEYKNIIRLLGWQFNVILWHQTNYVFLKKQRFNLFNTIEKIN